MRRAPRGHPNTKGNNESLVRREFGESPAGRPNAWGFFRGFSQSSHLFLPPRGKIAGGGRLSSEHQFTNRRRTLPIRNCCHAYWMSTARRSCSTRSNGRQSRRRSPGGFYQTHATAARAEQRGRLAVRRRSKWRHQRLACRYPKIAGILSAPIARERDVNDANIAQTSVKHH
jgi:hypothetical protein